MKTHNLQTAWQVRQAHFPPQIIFANPADTAVISLTGTWCALNCAHCGRHYLRHMTPIGAVNPQELAAPSCLISGGCDKEGRVPVMAHLEQVAALRPGRRLNWHVGLIGEEEAQAIAPYVDVVSFDFVGDDRTIHEVYGLDKSVADYEASYRILRRYATVFPHLTVGLRGGELGHELPALERLAALGGDGLVVLVFIPTPGTRYADREPPPVSAVVDILVEARHRFPDKPLYLGCMRPGGQYRRALDPLAVQAGVNVIVNPVREAAEVAASLGLQIVHTRECCVL